MPPSKQVNVGGVWKIEMNLSALGVESDGAPSIRAIVDLKSDTSFCAVSYYDPKFRAFMYRLSKGEMDSVRELDSVRISDYGCDGPSPLKELYNLVYRPDKTLR